MKLIPFSTARRIIMVSSLLSVMVVFLGTAAEVSWLTYTGYGLVAAVLLFACANIALRLKKGDGKKIVLRAACMGLGAAVAFLLLSYLANKDVIYLPAEYIKDAFLGFLFFVVNQWRPIAEREDPYDSPEDSPNGQ